MNLTAKDYNELNKKASPNTKSYITIPSAFIIGGIICTIGQALINLYMNMGVEKQDASTLASVSLVFLSAVLTGLKVYDNIAKFGGAGTLVPITGFSNAVVSPALEFKSEGLILGLGAKMFVIAGPVLVYGITASAVYGIILSLFNLG
ncbi:MAG: stage V sporulation protein AC [Oscillospiraceae bacterium]|nr:stage V sporulation protein AC [Oscillospiraceae bacterium]